MKSSKPIGLLFGSFNPFHNGHLFLVNQALKSGKFAKLVLVVHESNQFKKQSNLETLVRRLDMTKLGTKDVKNLSVTATSRSKLLDSANEIKKAKPNQTFAIILSKNLVESFQTWQDYEAIKAKFGISVFKTKLLPDGTTISSDLVRQKLAKNQNAAGLVPELVLHYIKKNMLYL